MRGHTFQVGATNWKRNVTEQKNPHNADRIILDFRTQVRRLLLSRMRTCSQSIQAHFRHSNSNHHPCPAGTARPTRPQLDWMESVTKAIAKRAASFVEVSKTWSAEISAMKDVMAMQVSIENDIGDNAKVEFANPFFPKMRETTVHRGVRISTR